MKVKLVCRFEASTLSQIQYSPDCTAFVYPTKPYNAVYNFLLGAHAQTEACDYWKRPKNKELSKAAADFHQFHLKTKKKMEEWFNKFSKVSFSINFRVIFQ
jgi:hypothetical protein